MLAYDYAHVKCELSSNILCRWALVSLESAELELLFMGGKIASSLLRIYLFADN